MLVEFISGIDPLILSPSPNPTSSRLELEVFLISVSVFVFTSSNEIFSHQVMLHLLDWNSILCSATICLLASVPFAYCIYHLQCNVVIISIFQLHSIKQAWMYIMLRPIKLYLGHTWFHWPTFQYVFPNYLWEKDLTLLWNVQSLTIIGKGR